jgi:hypothetical protein
METEEIFRQESIITSKFNETLLLDGLKSQLSSHIFRELIDGEKYGLKVTITFDVILDPIDTD